MVFTDQITCGNKINLEYHMVKNFGGKKVWQKGYFARIGEKNLGEC